MSLFKLDNKKYPMSGTTQVQLPFGLGVKTATKAVTPILSKVGSTLLSGVKSLATSFSKLTLKQKAVTTTAALVGAGYVSTNPIQSAKDISKVPSSLVNIGKNIGEVRNNPSLANVKNVFTENPVATSVLGVATAGVLGAAVVKTASPLISYVALKSLVKSESSNAPKEMPTQLPIAVPETKDKGKSIEAMSPPPNSELGKAPASAPATAMPSTTPVPTTPIESPITQKNTIKRTTTRRKRRSNVCKAKHLNKVNLKVSVNAIGD
jgi:hypothetical protein